MPTQPFTVSISERPSIRLYGLAVSTNMNKAQEDCPALWKDVFAPRMPEISGKNCNEAQGQSYGVSIMTDPGTGAFDYWAAMPAPEGAPLPEGMNILELPGGLYAGCRVPSLALLGEAYNTLYTVWPGSEKKYALNMLLPCFELYDAAFCRSGELELYVPVLENGSVS